MAEIIQLVTVENTCNHPTQPSQQKLVFIIQVARLTYDKQVEVIWCGENGLWQTLKAHYLNNSSDDLEYWQAKISWQTQANQTLPGTLRFAIRCRSQGQEYWDNNQYQNYISLANSGLTLQADRVLQNLNLKDKLRTAQRWLTIKLAVNQTFSVDTITVHWTTDNWQTVQHNRCRLNKHSQHAVSQIWTAKIKLGEVFKLQYAISAYTSQGEYWDNNAGSNYHASRSPLNIMILNLHCYQEEQQDAKFSQIAKAINDLAVDVVCLQEVAEHWNHGHGDWSTNSANIINQRLKRPFHLYTDWSHLGFDRYREGVAILSRYQLLQQQSRYVSEDQNIYSINSRKVVMAQISVPYFGLLNIYSAHLSWWEGGFQQQFNNLCNWANSLTNPDINTTLLCGDFNITAGSTGYWQVVDQQQYEDQYLKANAKGLFDRIYQVNDAHWRNYPSDDYRIDYIFMNKQSHLQVTSARVVFTEQDYGQVSDHCGYLMTFEPK